MNHSNLQRRGFTLWQLALVLVTLGILAAILLPVFGRGDPAPRGSSCRSNLKQIMLGFKQYIQDYDEKYPPVSLAAEASTTPGNYASFGWADALQPYLKSTQLFQCPSEINAPQTDPTQRNYTDYWLNARTSGIRDEQFSEQWRTIIIGEGNDSSDGTNGRYHLMSISSEWRSDQKSPLHRHLGGANYAFVDGHAKMVKANVWKNETDMHNGLTFRLKPKN